MKFNRVVLDTVQRVQAPDNFGDEDAIDNNDQPQPDVEAAEHPEEGAPAGRGRGVCNEAPTVVIVELAIHIRCERKQGYHQGHTPADCMHNP